MQELYEYTYQRVITDPTLDTDSRLRIIKLCIESGTDINSKPVALINAIKTNDYGLVKLLLESGADVNYDKPAAFLAAFQISNYYPMVELLLEFGADIHCDEYQILTEAISQTHDYHLIKLLLDNGIDANISNGAGIYYVFSARSYNTEPFVPNMDILKLLIERGAVPTDHIMNTTICLACNHDHLDSIKFLVSLGANPSAQNNMPMCIACANHNLNIVQYLASLGASYTEPNNKPIFEAFQRRGGTEIKKLLLESGADPNIIYHYPLYATKANACPLDMSVISADLENCKLLFAYGADVALCNILPVKHTLFRNIPDEYQKSEFVNLFMSHGLDISEYFEKI